MQICKLVSISSIIFLIFLQFPLIIVIENAPIVPILTAIATSAAGLFQIQIDTLHIAKYLHDASHHKRNRGAFVRDLLYTAFYRSGQEYNVIVFNLAEEHRQRLHGVIFYGSVAFADHTRFGIWVFEYGMFENKGARGWHNWGMIGSFKKSKNGAIIYFHRRHRPNLNHNTTNKAEENKNTTIELKTKHLQDVFGIDDKFKMENIEIKNKFPEQSSESKTKIDIKIKDKRTKSSKANFKSTRK